ncbi:MAG: hypothetical protein IKE66_02305 [Hyphomicrobium sp.]|nr:hypothetical protein [Hyphomicrobium sp.]
MDIVLTLLSPIIWLLGWLFAIVWWVASYLLWAIIWLLLPFAIVAFVAFRVAEKMLGPEIVRAWLKKQSLKFGANTWVRVRRLTFALTALPVRVLGWLVVYTVWHSLISLFWKPRWHPWTRAWAKRWKPPGARTRRVAASTKTQTAKPG